MGAEGCFKGRVKGVLWVFQGCFMGVSRMLQGRSRVVQGGVKCVSEIGQGCFNYVLRLLQDKCVSRAL